jgi:hypothetical protein
MAELFQHYEQPPPRPVFITVLCILTFIGSGWGVISHTVKYFTANSQAAAITLAKEKVNSDLEKSRDDEGSRFAKKLVNSIEGSPENIRKAALSDIMGAVLCLAGAVLMWHLKRTGFYLYVAGTLVSAISPFVIFGGTNMGSVLSSFITTVIGLVFTVLYLVNLRYMK